MYKFEEWTIAYRNKNGECFIDNTDAPFRIIQNTWRYWCADPHLFEKDGHTYLFAELYDRILRRGVIGCCEINDEGYTPWKVVLKMPWHLSYPHVFACGDEIYMIPESYVRNEIALFRATHFPDKWEKVHVLKEDYIAVDSTVFEYQNKTWLQTFQFESEHEKLNLFSVENRGLSEESLCISMDDHNKRPAGRLFWRCGKFYRPAQDCTESYGCALNIYEVTKISIDSYEESLVKKIRPEEIQSDFKGIPQGIHTYNASDQYEVIDLKSYETDLIFPFMRVFWFLYRNIMRVLGK